MKRLALLILAVCWVTGVNAALTIEITEGVEGALPIAVVPFVWVGPGTPPAQNVADIVNGDLARSGRFRTLAAGKLPAQPQSTSEVDFRDWQSVEMESLVIGQVRANGPGGYLVRFQLFDVYKGEQIVGYDIPTTEADLRATAHGISDLIYEKLTGERGAFSTRIAYVTSTDQPGGKPKVALRVADADGYNAQTIVTTADPLMSPAWSPDGKRIAYVSFEKGRPGIFIQEVLSGRRQKLTSFEGINGAPAWSPDGRRLAMTLSKDGNPDIYVMTLSDRSLRRLTRHYSIDTEPAWSPDGRRILFTSDRGGGPQIYEMPVAGGAPKRQTYEGGYNARASYSPDGARIAFVTRVEGNYRIAVLDLESGLTNILTTGRLDESPSFAPNGSMIIYATSIRGTGELAAVSVDGRVRQRLALQAGDVREPVWSPFSSKDTRR